MHKIYNPANLLNKPLEISYYKDFPGEPAKVIDIGDGQYKIEFENSPDDDDEPLIWIDEIPEDINEWGAYFTSIGEMENFYLKIDEEQKLEYTNNMNVTVKELSEKLGVDVVYVNGFLQTLVKLGKASIVGKVERPAGTRGKPSNIYAIEEGIIPQ
jgi:hypothetical protein